MKYKIRDKSVKLALWKTKLDLMWKHYESERQIYESRKETRWKFFGTFISLTPVLISFLIYLKIEFYWIIISTILFLLPGSCLLIRLYYKCRIPDKDFFSNIIDDIDIINRIDENWQVHPIKGIFNEDFNIKTYYYGFASEGLDKEKMEKIEKEKGKIINTYLGYELKNISSEINKKVKLKAFCSLVGFGFSNIDKVIKMEDRGNKSIYGLGAENLPISLNNSGVYEVEGKVIEIDGKKYDFFKSNKKLIVISINRLNLIKAFKVPEVHDCI